MTSDLPAVSSLSFIVFVSSSSSAGGMAPVMTSVCSSFRFLLHPHHTSLCRHGSPARVLGSLPASLPHWLRLASSHSSPP
jgi:hypothetical protein